LIVSLFALQRGLLRIVQVSLLGSILSNLLLVLGCAFFAGGISYKAQRFNRTSCAVNGGMLVLSLMSLLFPQLLDQVEAEGSDAGLQLSRSMSLMLLVLYFGYLYFQLGSHSHLFEDDGGGDGDDENDEEGEEGEDEEEAVLGVWGSVFWLAVITAFISLLSEYMVDALEGASVDWGVPDLFLGTIVIPIVGNAAEHAAAIIFAVKNKMELALGIAVGSSVQIAIFVVPMLVLVAWSSDVALTLDFHAFETGCLLITVLLVSVIIQSGESNWLQGAMLIVAYCAIAAGFFVHTDAGAIERREL
jgi:Ca2+:H+ antiporter